MKIVVRDVTFVYNRYAVLRGVSLGVAAGEIVSIIGPNGSGKSTLLRCLARVLQPQQGVVFLNGREIPAIEARQWARQVGYLPQAGGTAFPITVLEAVLMGRKPHIRWGVMARDLEAVERAMRYTGVEEMARRPLGELSGGERQKVLLARALAQEPEVLLLDEPTTSLDILHQLEILELLRQLAVEQGKAVVMVMHELNLAARFSDKLILLKEGSIFATGRPEEVLSAANIKAVYGVEAAISKGRFGLEVLPLRPVAGRGTLGGDDTT